MDFPRRSNGETKSFSLEQILSTAKETNRTHS